MQSKTVTTKSLFTHSLIHYYYLQASAIHKLILKPNKAERLGEIHSIKINS